MKLFFLISFLFSFYLSAVASSKDKLAIYFSSKDGRCGYQYRVVQMGLDKIFDAIRKDVGNKAEIVCFPPARLKKIMHQSSSSWMTIGALSWYPDLAFKYEKSLPLYRYAHRVAVKNYLWKNFDDLKGKSIVTIRGYNFGKAFYDKLEKYKIHLNYVESTDSCLGMVIYGRTDGCLEGTFELRAAAAKLKQKPHLIYLEPSESLQKENVYMLFSKQVDDVLYRRIHELIRENMPHILQDQDTCCE